MASSNLTINIVVDNTAKEVFDAITNVRGWWSEEIEGRTDTINEEWNYQYKDDHRCKIKTIALVPHQKVVWLVLENYFSFAKNKTEWIGDMIEFEISEKDGKTKMQFTQVGLTSECECYDICENAWTNYIQKSLYNLITAGEGNPNRKVNS